MMKAGLAEKWAGKLVARWYGRKPLPVHWIEQGPVPAHDAWTHMLQRWVTPHGAVDYSGWRQELSAVDSYLQHLASHLPANNWSRHDVIAYWINAYNALTIRLILQHPQVTSIRQIYGGKWWRPTAFDRPVWDLGGRQLSLNDIEHRLLRPLGQPAIHMAINCASASCPVLRREAYEPGRLDNQLAEQTLQFLQDPTRNRLQEGSLSPIFHWFADDFGGKEGVAEWIETQTGQAMPRISYISYDWTLNVTTTHEQDRMDTPDHAG